jgi:hypothetical protein
MKKSYFKERIIMKIEIGLTRRGWQIATLAIAGAAFWMGGCVREMIFEKKINELYSKGYGFYKQDEES